MKTPYPLGGCPSRSTSSLSWSSWLRASRKVMTSFSLRSANALILADDSASCRSSGRVSVGATASRRRSCAISSFSARTWASN